MNDRCDHVLCSCSVHSRPPCPPPPNPTTHTHCLSYTHVHNFSDCIIRFFRFMELSALLDPGRPPKTDKAAILLDAAHLVTQLRGEARKLNDSNTDLQEKIKELKAEKNELRDEKQGLKAEKEKLEQQLKTTNVQPGFLPAPTMPAAFAAQDQATANKFVPVISYPGVAMWQFMPPAAVDTSQDHVLRPPVA
ncbi:transcription factor ILR3-like [Olea europaea subsp. europaea]|nr:transcription factor ILR3-like [Olea europaea subsp. europaea]